jgi:hypothetical protein
MPQPPHSRPVRVETFRTAKELEDRLNELALDPANRFDLKFITDRAERYTAVFIYVPNTEQA